MIEAFKKLRMKTEIAGGKFPEIFGKIGTNFRKFFAVNFRTHISIIMRVIIPLKYRVRKNNP